MHLFNYTLLDFPYSILLSAERQSLVRIGQVLFVEDRASTFHGLSTIKKLHVFLGRYTCLLLENTELLLFDFSCFCWMSMFSLCIDSIYLLLFGVGIF